MAFELKSRDFRGLESLIEKIIAAHQAGEVTEGAAVGAIIHVIAAAALDNEDEVEAWAHDPAVFDDWKRGVSA